MAKVSAAPNLLKSRPASELAELRLTMEQKTHRPPGWPWLFQPGIRAAGVAAVLVAGPRARWFAS